MKIVEKNINEIKPYEKNPRKNDEAVKYVAESIKQFGFKVPIVIDKKNVIVAGHTRYKASKKLGIEVIPCVIADDLTDEQIKAFRLADNKVSEKADWDFDLLNDEIDDILNIDMSDFGFEIDVEEEPDIEEPVKQNERERTNNAYNLNEFDEMDTEGFYQMPTIKPIDYMPNRLTGFNYALSTDDYEQGIHFFLDDYQFERIWNRPQEYIISKLYNFECVLTPDFSLYMDMPIAMKIWNTYRSRLIGRMMQRLGLKVIPTVSWAEKETFMFCFDGLPKDSTLAISSVGIMRDENAFKIWKDGTDEMIKRLTPRKILCYGSQPDYDFGDIDVTFFGNTNSERMKGSKKK